MDTSQVIFLIAAIYSTTHVLYQNHKLILTIKEDRQGLLKVIDNEIDKDKRKILINLAIKKICSDIKSENKILMIAIIGFGIGEFIFYYFIDSRYLFIAITIIALLVLFSLKTIKMHLMTSEFVYRRKLNDINKH